MSVGDVTQHTLTNGLEVILKESHRAPVASFWVWYRVGSRNERAGRTGVSHWVEHMMFRGTERFPAGTADRLIARVGGYHNAMTYLDWTAYFATLPASELGLALELEADRMLNAQFGRDDTERERTVIISERQAAEDSPVFLLQEQVLGTAFQAHSYGHPTIGHLADLQTITREDLVQHYWAFYAPSNAIIVAVGDFDSAALMGQIEDLFRSMPPGPPAPPPGVTEPEQAAAREVQVAGPGDTAYLMVVYHAPPVTHEDFFPLVVADTLLGGPRSMAMFGDGEASRTARLYRALVDSGLASEASSYLLPTIDPYLFNVLATVQAGQTPERVQQALLAEVERLATEPVGQDELRRAVHQTRAQFVYSFESVTDQAYWLGFSAAVASLAWLDGFLDSLAAVTAADVLRVARRYFTSANRTTGYYVPGATSGGNGVGSAL